MDYPFFTRLLLIALAIAFAGKSTSVNATDLAITSLLGFRSPTADHPQRLPEGAGEKMGEAKPAAAAEYDRTSRRSSWFSQEMERPPTNPGQFEPLNALAAGADQALCEEPQSPSRNAAPAPTIFNFENQGSEWMEARNREADWLGHRRWNYRQELPVGAVTPTAFVIEATAGPVESPDPAIGESTEPRTGALTFRTSLDEALSPKGGQEHGKPGNLERQGEMSGQIEQIESPEGQIEALPLPGEPCYGCDTPGWLWMFGVESTFLFPDSNSVGAAATVATPNRTFHALPNSELHFGPRVWLGMDYGWWGIIGRFWHQNGANQDVLPFVPSQPRPGLIRESAIEAYTVDFELTRRFCCSQDWNFNFNTGFRFASLEDVGYLAVTQAGSAIPPAVVSANAFAMTRVDGPGITLAVGGDKPVHLFCCSWLDFYWKMRGSMVWGSIDSAAQTSVIAIDPDPTAMSSRIDAASARTADELFIGEFQVGLRWEHALKCAPAVAFFNFAFEYQWWDADGGFAETTSFASANLHNGTATATAGPDIEFNLVGFTAGAGLTW